DSSRWVWNSEITLFNRKGFEIENHDPLDRYNSGQYGYNQTLAIAAAQNAKNREMFFDGLEDYNYKTDTCLSCGLPRFINLSGGGTMVDTVSHTGRYSLRVGGNQSDTALVKIGSYAQDTVSASLSIKVDSLYTVTTTVTGTGTGLPGTYYRSSNNTVCQSRTDATINFNWGTGSPGGSCPADQFYIIWDGKIQPRYTDQYYFYCDRDDGIRVWIEDTLIMSQQAPWGKINSENKPVRLTAGKLYRIRIEFNEVYGNSYINMQWRSASGRQALELLPQSQLYPLSATDASVASTIHNDTTTYCYIQSPPKPTRITLDRFSPLEGRKMLLSAWIKEEQTCIPSAYLNSQILVTFNTGSPSSYTLKPTGKIIEGWQRVEDTVIVPAAAVTMKLTFKSTNSIVPVYFDDIRMHPFNSNMKSFVYDPINLRLVAELDENNYATFYEYDDDGTLVRLKKETERGIKTIKETRSALLKD
ncbi:MAG TPA: PA14 domain-containing protein, partial [Chitinophagaceae bacterium]|nr:PA14 domain-containing protein [Chitinophagaceae bacterium]